jgi:hypothetical protein
MPYTVEQTRVKVYRENDGLRRMFLISSNAYIDRENEIVKRRALQRYVDNFDGNDLLFWHGGEPIGKITSAHLIGPFLVEIAEELPDKIINISKPDDPEPQRISIARVWDFIEETQDKISWGASIGFLTRPADKLRAIFGVIRKIETSVLPLVEAANVLTLSRVWRSS